MPTNPDPTPSTFIMGGGHHPVHHPVHQSGQQPAPPPGPSVHIRILQLRELLHEMNQALTELEQELRGRHADEQADDGQ